MTTYIIHRRAEKSSQVINKPADKAADKPAEADHKLYLNQKWDQVNEAN